VKLEQQNTTCILHN